MIIIKKTLLLFISVILLTAIYASTESDWLLSKADKGKYPTIEDSALALLAINKELASTTQLASAITHLKDHLTSCTSANSCNNKNLALAIWALQEIGDSSDILETSTTWLINSRTMFADTSGDWLIQVISPEAGTCKLINNEIPKNQTFNIEAGYTPWISVNPDMISSLNNLKIDCSSLTSSNLVLSLINRKTTASLTEYYIKEEKRGQKTVDVQLGIPCWGPTYRSTCDPDLTAYVLLALNKAGKSPDPSWLRQQSSLTSFQTALLYKLTSASEYLTSLESTQTSAGYWSPLNVQVNSLIYSLLPDSDMTNKTASWINSQKASEGCWPKPANFCNVKSTATALYALGSKITTPPLATENKTLLIDCDQRCDDLEGCICPSDCTLSTTSQGRTCEGEKTTGRDETPTGSPCITTDLCEGLIDPFGRCIDIEGDGCPEEDTGPTFACDNDNICDASEDCSCLDCDDKSCYTSFGTAGICNYNTGQCETEIGAGGEISQPPSEIKKEEEEKSRALFWFLMLIALLIAAGGGLFFAYKRGLIKFKKEPKKEGLAAYTPKLSLKPQPYKPRTHPRPSAKKSPIKKFLDKELDKSMQELEKLLRK